MCVFAGGMIWENENWTSEKNKLVLFVSNCARSGDSGEDVAKSKVFQGVFRCFKFGKNRSEKYSNEPTLFFYRMIFELLFMTIKPLKTILFSFYTREFIENVSSILRTPSSKSRSSHLHRSSSACCQGCWATPLEMSTRRGFRGWDVIHHSKTTRKIIGMSIQIIDTLLWSVSSPSSIMPLGLLPTPKMPEPGRLPFSQFRARCLQIFAAHNLVTERFTETRVWRNFARAGNSR